MDLAEEMLKGILNKETDKISNPIICFITHKPCKKCQPFCTHRQKEEGLRNTEPEPATWQNGGID